MAGRGRRGRSPRRLGLVLAWLALAAAAPADPPHQRPSDMLGWTAQQQEDGFKRIATLFPVHLARRSPHPRPLPRSRRPLPIPPATVEAFMAAQRVSGLLVIQDGRIVLERYGLGRTPADPWSAFSVAKSVTSILVGAALQDGAIKSLDDPVTRYLPEMRGGAYDQVSVRELVTMTSGVRWTEDYADLSSDVVRIGSWAGEPGIDPLVSYMRTLPRVAPPGTRFQYKSGEADLAGVLVARAVGMPMAAYLEKRIWRPAGMEADAAWIHNAAGNDRGGCCLSLGLRDSGRLGLLMLNGGQAGGRRILPKAWVAAATTKQVDTGYPDMGYGYLWWTRPGGEFQANGIFGQTIDVIPDERLVIVVNSAWPRPSDRAMAAERAAFIDKLRAAARTRPN